MSSSFKKNVVYFESIDSTNKKALQMAREGAEEGTIVWAGYQTMGRGRLGKTWFATPGQNMLLSVICRPALNVSDALKITLAAALIVKRAVESFLIKSGTTVGKIQFKWPNDVFLKQRKLAGILCESIVKNDLIDALVVGIGVNLIMDPSEYPDEIKNKAIALSDVCNVAININEFVNHFINIFSDSYVKIKETGFRNIISEWMDFCMHKTRPFTITKEQGRERGSFYGLDEQGYLMYTNELGQVKKLIGGEITDY